MQRPDQNEYLLTKNLEKLLEKICVECRLGIADWDFNESLRSAIQTSKQTNIRKDTEKIYNDTFELALKSNIQLGDRYKLFYKLTKQK